MQDREIELKLSLKNGDEVAEFLKLHATFKYEASQHDVYFNAPNRDFLANIDNVNEWLRIRVVDDKAQVNYKDWQPHESKTKTHCIEYETDVSSYDQLSKIFAALNFTKLIDVKKVRRSWDYKDVEISLDSVEELGEYIELEFKGETDSVDAARKQLFAILEELGVETGELDRRGYPHMLLERKGLLKANRK